MEPINNTLTNNQNNSQNIIFKQEVLQKNGVGIAGFVISITGLILCWVPILKWLLLVPAFLLSFIGMFKKPRTLAVIGTIISGLVILIIMIIKASFVNAIMSI